jgi:hypothetical protein
LAGDNSDKCEKELDNNSERELKKYYMLMPDVYKSDKAFKEAVAAAEVEEERGETDFWGFSSDNKSDNV